jgi:hypothetical protein
LMPFTLSRKQNEGVLGRIMSLITLEIKHRLDQINHFGLLPRFLNQLREDQPQSTMVTILPDITYRDYQIMLSNPSSRTLEHWVLKVLLHFKSRESKLHGPNLH